MKNIKKVFFHLAFFVALMSLSLQPSISEDLKHAPPPDGGCTECGGGTGSCTATANCSAMGVVYGTISCTGSYGCQVYPGKVECEGVSYSCSV